VDHLAVERLDLPELAPSRRRHAHARAGRAVVVLLVEHEAHGSGGRREVVGGREGELHEVGRCVGLVHVEALEVAHLIEGAVHEGQRGVLVVAAAVAGPLATVRVHQRVPGVACELKTDKQAHG